MKQTGTLIKPNPDEEALRKSPLLIEPNVLEAKIRLYNSRLKNKGSGLGITQLDGGKYRGFIRVHLNLTRPINVIAGTRPPSIYDIIKDDDETANATRRTLTSFYMPRDTVKNIHITSESSSLEVIKSMLKKFKIVDNPQKFALYQSYPAPVVNSGASSGDHVSPVAKPSAPPEEPSPEYLLKRIGDQDKPLRIALEWLDSDDKKFVLQENDTGDIAWDAFALPELNNFLMILKREEEEHVLQVKLKYNSVKAELNSALEFKLNQQQRFEGTLV